MCSGGRACSGRKVAGVPRLSCCLFLFLFIEEAKSP